MQGNSEARASRQAERRAHSPAQDTAQVLSAEQRMQQMRQQDRESLHSTLRHLTEAEQVGAEAATTLGRQGEQLDKAADDLATTNAILAASERTMRGIQSWGGALWNWATGGPDEEALKAKYAYKPDAAQSKSSKANGQPDGSKSNSMRPELSNGGRKGSQTGAKQQPQDALARAEQEDEEDMDQILKSLGTLKGQADDINKELTRQQKVLEYLDRETESTDRRLARNTKKLQRGI
eukprot:g55094.t1